MKLKSYIYALIASVIVLFSACSPEEYDLGAKDLTADDLVEGIAYTITHDADNPNIVYLESKLGTKYTALWEHPQGRSQEQKVTLNMAFEGTYTVKFGVETSGGVVYGEPETFTIENFYAGFVSGDLWNFLAGGAGNEKTWIPDNGKYGMKQGFYSCFDPSTTWADMKPNDDNPYNWYALDKTWWEPTDSDVGVTEDDLASYMTFSLKGKAGLTLHRVTGGVENVSEGLFSLNTDNRTMSAIDVDFLHGSWADGKALDFRTGFQVLVLTENQLMIGNLRDEGLSGEGPCIFCWNFVSKEYADNYVAPEKGEVFPELPEDWRDYVEPKTNKVITYKLSDDTPFDWCNFDGSLKGIDNISPLSGIEDVTLVFNSGTGDYTFTDIDGKDYTGKYTLNNDGIYTFSEALPEIVLSTDGRAVFETNSDRTLRIMSYETSDYTGAITDLWLGSKEFDDQGNLIQYMGYHFAVQNAGAVKTYKATLSFFDTDWAFIYGDPVFISGDGNYTLTVTGASATPYGFYLDIEKILKDNPDMDVEIKDIKVDGTSITFDDNAIDRGTGDAATTARRYIINPWGTTAGEAPNYVFSSSIAVTISVTMDNGTPFIKPD